MSEGMMQGPQNDPARGSAASPSEAPTLNLRRLESIQRLLQYGAVLVLLVFLGLIGLSWFQLRRINNEIATAEESLRETKLEISQLKLEADNLRAEKSGLIEVTNALTVATRSLGGQSPEDGEKVKQAIEQSIAQTSDPDQIPARIYIQVGREDQRKRAAEVARKLQAQGYVVPGLEHKISFELNRIRGIEVRPAPRVSQLRYYQDNAVSQKDIHDIVTLLHAMGVELKQVLLPPLRVARARHYEIWFGDDF